MRTISQLLLSFLLNAGWQVAVICGVASICAWLLKSTTARYQHALWVTALLLSIFVPLLSAMPAASTSDPAQAETVVATRFSIEPVIRTEVVPSAQNVVASENAPIRIGSTPALALLSLYAMLFVYSLGRLLLAWKRTRNIVRSARPIDYVERIWAIIEDCQKAIGAGSVTVLVSSSVHVPITAGFRNPSIILPEKFLTEGDVDLLTSGIGHELIHVRRRDYILNLIYEMLYVPLSFHPAAVLIKRRISQTRELCCDELVAEKLQNARVYARSLVHLAAAAPHTRPLAVTTTVGIADADNLEVRVMSLLRKPKLDVRRKRLLLIAASFLLILPCVASASFALKFDTDTSLIFSPQEPTVEDKRIKPIYRPQPEYPDDARAEKIEGTVRLLVTVDPKGSVKEVEVTRPVYPSLDESAVQAVRNWKFAPFSVNGQPADRKIATEVIFNLYSSQNKEREEREREEMEKVEGEKGKRLSQDLELKMRRQLEIDAKVKAQAELARHVRISMDQAIQIATSKYPGTVLECSLVAQRWEAEGVLAKGSEVYYHVLVVDTNEPERGNLHVLVSGIDGRIIKAEKEGWAREQEAGRRPISAGVLNGSAIRLPAPEYPAIARAAGAEGMVSVEVVIDEEGNVIEARAASGHPLLQSAAVSASRMAKFKPTYLEGEPVRVKGMLTYSFVKQ